MIRISSGGRSLKTRIDENTSKPPKHRPTECYCYILECSDGTYYTGSTFDPEQRIKLHNAGRGSRYTRSRLPVRLVYLEFLADRGGALKREVQIKKLSRRDKQELIHQIENN